MSGAGARGRTPGLPITKRALYQLSYAGDAVLEPSRGVEPRTCRLQGGCSTK